MRPFCQVFVFLVAVVLTVVAVFTTYVGLDAWIAARNTATRLAAEVETAENEPIPQIGTPEWDAYLERSSERSARAWESLGTGAASAISLTMSVPFWAGAALMWGIIAIIDGQVKQERQMRTLTAAVQSAAFRQPP